jgi:aspartyl-tRNA(Asn)/glutamyl-tRNA(Gln) amidotransferase subunit A
MDPDLPSISELRRQFQSGERKPAEFVEELAAAIDARDAEIGSLLGYDLDAARAEAEAADLSLPLGGVPVAIKDNINVRGQPCTCGSRFLAEGYQAPYDATVVRKLREAGAIPFGRANLDEFAMGSSTENSALQRTCNPAAPDRIPGGSSGGAAAAVAARLAVAALGSDTGGSIRQLVDNVEDAALVLQAIAGHDPRDSTSLDVPVPDYLQNLDGGVAGMKLGVPREYFGEGINPAVRTCVQAAIDKLAAAGAELVEVSMPHTEYTVATYYIIAPAEASSNLSRFDGVRYGLRTDKPEDVIDLHRRSREAGFGPEVKRRIILGTYVLSSGYYDAYYSRAQKVRTLIRRDFEQAFEQVDALLTPVAPEPARRIGSNTDPLQEYLSDIFTLSANLAGICGISVPCGAVDADGGTKLPVGLQILGPHLGEPAILRVARAAEGARNASSA